MSQNYNALVGTDSLTASRTTINNNLAAIISAFSGTVFPSNPVVGQSCYRTDTQCIYLCKSIGPAVWYLQTDLTKTILTQEAADARYLKIDGSNAPMTGSLSFADNMEGIILSAGGKIVDQSTGGNANACRTIVFANNDSFEVLSEDGNTFIFSALAAAVAPRFKGNDMWHAGNLFPARGLRSPTEPPNNYNIPASAPGNSYYMRLDQGVQVFNLPNAADIYDGWSCVVFTTDTLPSGYQTAYVQTQDGNIIWYRIGAATKHYLIGRSEAFRFTWMATWGSPGTWFAQCIRPPGMVTVVRRYTGSGTWNTGNTAAAAMAFNVATGSSAVFTNGPNSTRVPVTGVWRHYHRLQPGANSGGGVSGSAQIMSCNDDGVADSTLALKYINLTAGEDSEFIEASWISVSPAGSYSTASYSMSTTGIWYYPDNNYSAISLIGR